MLAEPLLTLPRIHSALSFTPVPLLASQVVKYFQTCKPCEQLAIRSTKANCKFRQYVFIHFYIKVFQDWDIKNSAETVDNSKKKTGIKSITSVGTIYELEAVLWE